ncbi:Inositolphosphorylceramide synthase subunit Kei1-domain-containing protein [Multifurca ochricompacta]|uniref:Inositolphosphorylceramide synthase subunit Kei1-domain-containing protein n=1 Tax=Multifurca ochricompacta TaxID=376703 RepID=A0AAD4MAN3_9AGAM|nr:Inositolphosphorylceramide synthase subunit Kei1-domain-containing protein [Multifurca ochricompacta]
MKLTLKQQLRPRPFASMLGFLDLKTGVTLVVLFAVLNKVAGVYGLIAMLTGAGGNAAQLTLYIYSVFALVALTWGIRAVNDENPKHMLYFSHVFFADHVLNTIWTVYFAVHWWLYTPHDGRRNANSPAQQALIDGYIGQHQTMSEAERVAAAERVWRSEKAQALTIIILGWLIKFYFAALLYSFAHHLRRGSYRSLPLSRTGTPLIKDSFSTLPPLDADNGGDSIDADVDLDSFYDSTTTLPVHNISPPSAVTSINNNNTSSAQRSRGTGAGSTGSFADFVSAPPPRRARRTRGSLLAGGATRTASNSGSAAGSSSAGMSEGEEDEASSIGTGTSRART